MKKKLLILLSAALCAMPAAVSAQKKPIDESVYDKWKRVVAPQVSDNGTIVTYEVRPAVGDGMLAIHNMADGSRQDIQRGSGARIFGNQRWISYSIAPTYEENRRANIDKLQGNKKPKAKKYLLNLATRDTINITELENPLLLKKAEIIAFTMKDKQAPAVDSTAVPAADSIPQPDGMRPQLPRRVEGDSVAHRTPQRKPVAKDIKVLCMVDLVKKDTLLKIRNIEAYLVTGDGSRIIYTAKEDSVTTLSVWNRGTTTEVANVGKGLLANLTFDTENENQFVYTLVADSSVCKDAELFYVNLSALTPKKIGYAPEGLVVQSNPGSFSFSKKGGVLRYGVTEPYKKPEKDTLMESEKFTLDLWSYHDKLLPSQQVRARNKLQSKSSQVIYDLRNGYGRRLSWDDNPFLNASVPAEIDDMRFVIMSDNGSYVSTAAWNYYSQAYDYYIYWLGDDRREMVLEAQTGAVTSSPGCGWVAYYDMAQNAWCSLDPDTKEKKNLTGATGVVFWDEVSDIPATPKQYGAVGWTKTRTRNAPEMLVVYDRYDLWLLDPSGRKAPKRLTEGREHGRTFRVVRTDSEAQYLNEGAVILLSSVVDGTKDSGFWSLAVDRNGNISSKLRMLVEGPNAYNLAGKAKDADRVLWTRESFTEFPDLHTSRLDFGGAQKLSDANPEMKDYLWGSVRITEWEDPQGKTQKGLLYLPEDYDPARKYPTIIYYYERSTPDLHKFSHAEPAWSIVLPSTYASNGYVILMPDIEYITGQPMRCALNAVTSGAQALIDRGIADPTRIGIQGQSWGGTQTYYIITQTDMFRCASGGAGETNMVSGYGYLRGDSGLPRTFQYEQGQSRMGAMLWDDLDGYMANSALYSLPNVTTPLLMRHSDNDEAVSFHQGMQMYNGMRRLGKQVWMLNYNGGGHNLRHWGMKKDFDKRMMQFFDHYLKDAPMPRWMAEGITIRERGIDNKFEPAGE